MTNLKFKINNKTQIPTRFKARVNSKISFGTKFLVFKLELDHKIEYMAGQYVSILVDEKTRRAYSISSAPDGKRIELLVDTNPNGPASNLFKNINIGQSIDIIGPYGRFVVPEDVKGTLWFVATGSGLAPLKSQILDLLNKGYKDRIVLVYGTKFEEDVVFKDLFENLMSKYPNFQYYIAISHFDALLTQNYKYVTYISKRLISNSLPNYAFLCGHPKMMEDMKKFLIFHKVNLTNIFSESYV